MSTAYERQLLDGILCQFAGVVAQTVEADERCDVRISWRVVASITVAVTEHELPLVWGRGVLLVPPQLKMKCPAVKLDTTERTHKKRAQALHPGRESLHPPPTPEKIPVSTLCEELQLQPCAPAKTPYTHMLNGYRRAKQDGEWSTKDGDRWSHPPMFSTRTGVFRRGNRRISSAAAVCRAALHVG